MGCGKCVGGEWGVVSGLVVSGAWSVGRGKWAGGEWDVVSGLVVSGAW